MSPLTSGFSVIFFPLGVHRKAFRVWSMAASMDFCAPDTRPFDLSALITFDIVASSTFKVYSTFA